MISTKLDNEILCKFLGQETDKVTRMGGLSNIVYKIEGKQNTVIYRIYTSYFEIFLNRTKEVLIQTHLSKLNLAPNILYSDETKRIEEFKTYQSVNNETIKSNLGKFAVLLGKIHACSSCVNGDEPTIKKHINNIFLKQKILELSRHNSNLLKTFEKIFSEQVQSVIMNLLESPCLKQCEFVLAHNDLNSTNVLLDDNGDFYILDWETAGLNYPGYDIANFFNEMEWDYSYDQYPYFRVLNNPISNDDRQKFLDQYWVSYSNGSQIVQINVYNQEQMPISHK